MTDEPSGAPAAEQQSGADVEQEISPELGLVGAIAIGVGTMIAAGIFVLSGLAVSNVGAVAIVAFGIAAVVAGFTALAYAEFASIYLESGGGYMYVANTFDSNLTYIVGWSMILGYPASAAFYLASFSDWFFRFIYPVLSIPEAIPYWSAGLVILVLLVAINIKGTEETGLFQIVVTALKIALLALFLYGGLQAFDTQVVAQSFAENIGDFREIGLTTALVFITFFGFEAIATNAEEIEKPATNVPRAIFISMGVVFVIYTLVVIVIVLAINDTAFLDFLRQEASLAGLPPVEFVKQNGEIAMGRAAQYYLGQIGFYVIIAGALFSMLSAANATILAGSRVKMAMARRDHLPAAFEELHDTLNTPYKAVLLTGGLILFYLVVFSVLLGGAPGEEAAHGAPLGIEALAGLHLGIEALAHFADFMLLAGLIAVNTALIQSRRKYPDLERDFEVPLVPWMPVLAIIANVVLLFNVEPTALVMGLLAEVIGVGFWFAWKARAPSEEQIEEETPTATLLERRPRAREHDYQLVVPLASSGNLEAKMRTALWIARDRGGELLITTVATIPEQTPLSRGYAAARARRSLVEDAMQLAEDAGVPARGVVRIGHHAGEAIVNTVVQHKSQAVLMGWRGWRAPESDDAVLHTAVDRVVAEAPCDVFVEHPGAGESTAAPASILVPVGGGPHGELAVETARAIARQTGARVRIVRIVAPGASEREREQGASLLEERAAQLDGAAVETALVEGRDKAACIVREAEGHDVVIVGAAREGLVQRILFGTLPETVSEQLKQQTVIMAKGQEPTTSRLKQSIRYLWRS